MYVYYEKKLFWIPSSGPVCSKSTFVALESRENITAGANILCRAVCIRDFINKAGMCVCINVWNTMSRASFFSLFIFFPPYSHQLGNTNEPGNTAATRGAQIQKPTAIA